MLVVLSMTMATQYATTKIGFAYSIVHPSNADIRFIASDNSSDGYRVLRVDDPATNDTAAIVKLVFGNWSANQNKTYTAAFCIVNEERFAINITHINCTEPALVDYLQIWLHGNRSLPADTEDATAVVFAWNHGQTYGFDDGSCMWQLAAGNGDPTNMNDGKTHSITNYWTPESSVEHVRYSMTDYNAINGTADYVWIQISINIPADASIQDVTGSIWIHFKATTHNF